MKIKKIKIISYGKFKDKEIEFKDEVNIIYGKNESGKSTVMSFIKGMLYGFSGRGTSPSVNERKKYTPWDGSRVAGEITVLTDDGRELLISRVCGKTQSSDKTEVIDILTGEKTEFLPEEHIGLPEKAFSKTLYIGQLSSKIEGEDDEITNRLINLAQSGDEKNNYRKADDIISEAIKKYISRGNKGLINDTHLKISELRQELEDSLLWRKNQFDKTDRKKYLEAEIEKLGNELKELKEKEVTAYGQEILLKKIETEKNLAKLTEEQALAEKELENLKNEFSAYSCFEKEADSVIYEQTEDREVLKERIASLNKKAKNLIIFAVITFFTIVLPIIFIILSGKAKKEAEALSLQLEKANIKQAEFEKYNSKNLKEYSEGRAKYINLSEKIVHAQENLNKISQAISEEKIKLLQTELKLKEQGQADDIKIMPVNISEVLEEERRKENLLREYIKEEAEISGALQTALNGVREPSLIAAELENEQEKLKEYEKKYSALMLAKETLEKAYEHVSRDFAPELNRRASKIIEQITNESFDIIADKSYNIMVHKDGVHEIAYFSGGCCDQVYLALRIALAEMTAKKTAPLFLDDAFIQYDEQRRQKALDFIFGLKRQTIIFSCQSILREDANLIEL